MRGKALLTALLAFSPLTAWAETLVARVDISDQTMAVSLDGDALHIWPVSTARPGKFTPVGTFHPQSLRRMHYSSLYNNAPMPWSIFFYGNFAIHGTTAVELLGCPASAGCIRLAPENAEVLYGLVLQAGFADTWIIVQE
ncbi:L,D-transpeptidase [uncultured Aliiroseovarius sp.]|uniref:L,D-transpeptidase n=1 Tax=uncultured Aliiroseovarius sp. TaxID=1658783 RepID=UPI002598FC43|nr:L,D-transpeptidase [uncultured Aliiroseovarius sp.]MCI2399404.1 L,D-transpeptidase [Aliiroseovarius subalbicans]